MERVSTLRDIAKSLGVSTSTVSRILNGKNVRNKELVAKVRKAAKELNYQVNTAALGLRTNKTRMIGIIVPAISDEFFSSILAGIEMATEPKGYNLLICQSNESHEKEKKLIKSLVACNVEGVLISLSKETSDLSFLSFLKDSGKKAVLFDRILKSDSFPSIAFEDYQFTYEAGKHLIDEGKKSFLYVGLSEVLENDRERLRGYNAVLADHQLPSCKAVFVEKVDQTAALVAPLLQEGKIDAVVCYHDMIAVQVLSVLKAQHVAIPDQVALVGFDNRHLSSYTTPTLTSIDRSTTRMGEWIGQVLLAKLNEEDEPGPPNFSGHLIIRESTRSK